MTGNETPQTRTKQERLQKLLLFYLQAMTFTYLGAAALQIIILLAILDTLKSVVDRL